MRKFFFVFTYLLLGNFLYATKYSKKEHIKKDHRASSIKKKTINMQKKSLPKITSKKLPLEKKSFVTIINTLNKDKITYQKHWYKPVPTLCNVTINDQQILTTNKDGNFLITPSIQIATSQKKIISRFKWKIEKFGKVWHHEEKEIMYELMDNKKEFTLDFDWESKERLKIANAKVISCRELLK